MAGLMNTTPGQQQTPFQAGLRAGLTPEDIAFARGDGGAPPPGYADRITAAQGQTPYLGGNLNPQFAGSTANILPQSLPNSISGLYQSILGRAPDPGGLQNWTNAQNSGMSMADIAQAMASSAEGLRRSAAQPAGNPLPFTPASLPAAPAGGGPADITGYLKSLGIGGQGQGGPNFDFSGVMQSLQKGLAGLGAGSPTTIQPPTQQAPAPQQPATPPPQFVSSGSGLPQGYISGLMGTPISAQGIGAALAGGS